MGRKINTEFLAAFIELEAVCNALLDCKRGGVTEYINALKDAGSSQKKDETLQKLLTYRKIRNRLAHEEGALSEEKSVSRGDIRWLRSFARKVERGRDPISVGRTHRISPKKIIGLIFIAVAVTIAVVGFILLSK